MKHRRILILCLTLCANNVFGTPQVIDEIIAIVNNDIILESEIDSLYSIIKHSTQKANQQLPDNVILRRQILDRLIMNSIILQLAHTINITISSAQLNLAISNIAAQNHMSLNQLRRYLNHEGIDYSAYRTQICKDILVTKVRNNEVSRRVTITSQEVKSLAKQIAQTSSSTEYNLSHILIPLSDNPTYIQLNKAVTLANYIIKQWENSTNFSKFIATNSANIKDLQISQMGWGKLGDFPSLFTAHLHNTQKGNIIGPIRSGAGFHILKVNDIYRDEQRVTDTEVHVRHILLRTSVVTNNKQACTKLKHIATQIKNGRISFATAAKQMSEDPSSANQGGDLGWNLANKFDPVFYNTVKHLKKGEISTPVHSLLGWHLIQLINTRQVDCTDAAQINHAYQLLFKRRFVEETQAWMQEQRASSYIKIFDNNE